MLDPTAQEFVKKRWRDVRVGEVIIVHRDEYFPVDLLFLGAENAEGLCHIETMNLDGETNLKIKKALDQTKDVTRDNVGMLRARIDCEAPNSKLYMFTGNLYLEGGGSMAADANTAIPLSPACMLLRGCSLRNTQRVYGAVIYAGHDTKVFKNSTEAPSKRSTLERIVDKIILFCFSLLFSFVIIGAIFFAHWTQNTMHLHWYLYPEDAPLEFDPASTGVILGVTNSITTFILYGYLIPISLYVTIEMVKVTQSMVFIARDRDMYHPETDTPAVSALNFEFRILNWFILEWYIKEVCRRFVFHQELADEMLKISSLNLHQAKDT